MTLELINPDGLPTPASYTQVIAATGGRLVFVAGQVADDPHGNLVGAGDLAAQARQAFANVGRCLAAAELNRTTWRRSRSMSFTTGLSTCLRSRRPGLRYSAITNPPTLCWAWRRSPSPGT